MHTDSTLDVKGDPAWDRPWLTDESANTTDGATIPKVFGEGCSDHVSMGPLAEASLSHLLDRRVRSDTDRPFDRYERALDVLRSGSSAEVDPRIEAWLLSSGLLLEVAHLVSKVSQYMDGARVRLEVGRPGSDGPSLLVWVEHPAFDSTPDSVLDALDEFDFGWWLRQSSSLRSRITVLLA